METGAGKEQAAAPKQDHFRDFHKEKPIFGHATRIAISLTEINIFQLHKSTLQYYSALFFFYSD